MSDLSPTTAAILGLVGFVAASMAVVMTTAFVWDMAHRRERRRNRR